MNAIKTYSGHIFDYENIKESTIDIEDIARGLSNLCRFTGQTRHFYSVAEHCCILYDFTKPINKKLAQFLLIHDAPEAYMNDLASPLKALLPSYKAMETEFLNHLLDVFGIELTNEELIFVIERARTEDKNILTKERYLIENTKWFHKLPLLRKFRDIEFWKPNKAYKEYKKRLIHEFG
jgi:5'-deoxynucleotidase YfbR-like HD superfamily hydrolase